MLYVTIRTSAGLFRLDYQSEDEARKASEAAMQADNTITVSLDNERLMDDSAVDGEEVLAFWER